MYRDSPKSAAETLRPNAQPYLPRSLNSSVKTDASAGEWSSHAQAFTETSCNATRIWLTLIDAAAGARRPEEGARPADRITVDSMRTELATAKHRNRELNDRVQALERRLGAQGATMGPSVIDQHPVVLELRARLARLEVELAEKDRGIDSLEDDVEVLRETNRSLVREYGLHTTESRPQQQVGK